MDAEADDERTRTVLGVLGVTCELVGRWVETDSEMLTRYLSEHDMGSRAVHDVAQQVDCRVCVSMSFKSMCLYMSEPCMRWHSRSTASLRARVSMSLGTQAMVSQGILEAFVVAAEMWEHGTLQGGFQGFLQAWEAGVLCVCVRARACV